MKKYDQLLQVVRECDYRIVENLACGCQAAETRCLLGRGGWARDRHEVNPHDCLECTKGGEDGRTVVEDSETSKRDDGDEGSDNEPPITHRGDGTERIGAMVLESGIEREVLRLERELFLLQDDVRRLLNARFPVVEQQLAALWYNPYCVNPSSALTASPSSPQASGTNITFTETLTGSPTPTGTVQFLDGSTNIGSLQTLSGGVASVSTSTLSVATHTINAVYSGDNIWCPKTDSISYQITGSNFSVSGTITGCSSLGVPTCTVTFTDTTDTITYGTFVTDSSGNYSGSGSANIPSNPTTTHMHLTPGDPHSARFASFTPTNVSLAFGSNTGKNATLSAASGKYCSVLAYYPLNSTLTLTDSVATPGGITLTNSGSGWNGNNPSYSYPGCSMYGCSAHTIQVNYFLGGSVSYVQCSSPSGTGQCPISTGGATGRYVTVAKTSDSPFTASGNTVFGEIGGFTPDGLYCSSTPTITVHE